MQKIWKVLAGASEHARAVPQARRPTGTRRLPEELKFLHAEEILDMYPDLPRKQRETKILQEYPASSSIGIGWTLEDGYPHEMRAADYDDWVTETIVRRTASRCTASTATSWSGTR